MTREELDIVLAKHKSWLDNEEGEKRADLHGADLRGADLRGADLRGADLRYADLQRADLRGADFDYSAFPLWCGGTRFKADDRLVAQVLAHLCSLEVSDTARAELDKILPFARTSHRAKDCGILPENGDDE